MACSAAAAQGRTVLRAYAGDDGRAHVVLRDGTEFVAPKEGSLADGDQQQGVQSMQVSEDGRAAGWLVLFPNCCTSYPIPLEVVVYRDGKLLREVPGKVERPVTQWQFLQGTTQVAILYENLHGEPQFQAQLFDLASARLLKEWSEPEHRKNKLEGLPGWAQSFRGYMRQAL